MARPLKDGVDYWNKDTDFYRDTKIRLLRKEFGSKGMYLLDYLFCDIYGGEGYYLATDDDKLLLMSDDVGCGCEIGFIKQFLSGCCRRSLFDERLFSVFGVLTSAAIQRRYIRMMDRRDEIRIVSEFFLLDVNSKKDVPEKALNKIVLIPINEGNNSVNEGNNPVNVIQKPLKESKVKESKINEKESSGFPFSELSEWRDFIGIREQKGKISPKVMELIKSDLLKYSGGDKDKAIQILSYSLKGGYPMLYPLKSDGNESSNKRERSFDLGEYDRLTDVNPMVEVEHD